MKSNGAPENLRRGEVVRVKSREEILATLDERGRLDGLPFMPEMLRFCGQAFRVQARAHKTCDTINKSGGRRMTSAVHLEGLRCDGSAHGHCQAACLLFFKNAWLERASESDLAQSSPRPDGAASATAAPSPVASPATGRNGKGLSEAALQAATRVAPANGAVVESEIVYACQTTELYRATTPLAWWELGQYVEDVTSGNVSVGSLLNRLYFRFTAMAMAHLRGYRLWHALYDAVQRLVGGKPFPIIEGKLKKTPSQSLGLKPGDVVRVKSLDEIVATLDVRNRNRGMAFDKEQAVVCGERHVVQARVEQIIDEASGRMVRLPNDCLILKGVACEAVYSEKRIACPRAIYSYWRECWLERAEPEKS